MFIAIVMNIILGATSLLVVRRFFRLTGVVDMFIAFFVVFLAQIIVIEISLGILGMLTLSNVLISAAGFFCVAALCLRKRAPALPWEAATQVLEELCAKKTVLFICSVILAFAVIKCAINLISPPFGWDSLNYHFTFPVEWLKHGNLNNPLSAFGDPSPSYYPINGSLIFLWLMFPLKNVLLADLGQLPFFIIAGLAVYGISRKTCLSKEHAFYAGGLFLLIPNFFKQLEIGYVDIMVGALFLVAWFYLFVLEKSFSMRDIFLFSAALGLLIGIKTLAATYSILLIPPFLSILLGQRKKIIPALLLCAGVVIVLGGFSYARNYLSTGNPLYPVELKLLGLTIFEGVRDKASYTVHFSPQDYRLSKLLFHEGLSGQGPLFMFLPVFIALPLALLTRRLGKRLLLAYFLLTPLLLYGVYYFIISLPFSRYLYPLFGLAMIFGFLVIDMLRIPQTVTRVLVTLCVLGSMSTLASHGELVAGIISSLVLFFVLLALRRHNRLRPFFAKPFAWRMLRIALASMVITGLFVCNNYYNAQEHARYVTTQEYSGFEPQETEAWRWLNEHTGGDHIAYAGKPLPFPLYGEKFKNDVYYVSVNEVEPAQLHFYPKSRYQWGADFLQMHESFQAPENYRGKADYAIWLAHLKKRDTDYLFSYSLQQTKQLLFSLEDSWARQHPEFFEPVFERKKVRIYKVKKY